jgi:hypothetical protein
LPSLTIFAYTGGRRFGSVSPALGGVALLNRLTTDPKPLADRRPRLPGPARLVDEEPDQVITELAEFPRGLHGPCDAV